MITINNGQFVKKTPNKKTDKGKENYLLSVFEICYEYAKLVNTSLKRTN
jgi:hypothetical protein